MNALIIFLYPLLNVNSARRIMKHAKYLRIKGIEPFLLVVDELANPSDDVMCQINIEIPRENIYIVKRSLVLKNYPFVSKFSFFRRYTNSMLIFEAVSLASEIVLRHQIQCIYSSSLPFSSSVVSSFIQYKYGLPWVAEFRDLWSKNHTKKNKKIESIIERLVLKNASRLVTVSEDLAGKLSVLHRKKVDIIFNGFDLEDYTGDEDLLDPLTITYTGTLYRQYQSARVLFSALSDLRKENKISNKEVRVLFYGNCSEIVRDIDAYDLQSFVEYKGTVSYDEIVRVQKSSSILLFLEWNDGSQKGILTTKIFEYLGARRPILCVGDIKTNNAAPIVEQEQCGVCIYDVDSMKEYILESIQKYKKNKNLGFTFKNSFKYSREYQAGLMFDVLKKVIQE